MAHRKQPDIVLELGVGALIGHREDCGCGEMGNGQLRECCNGLGQHPRPASVCNLDISKERNASADCFLYNIPCRIGMYLISPQSFQRPAY